MTRVYTAADIARPIAGRVTDAGNGQPLVGATLTAGGSDGSSNVAYRDVNGYYSLTLPIIPTHASYYQCQVKGFGSLSRAN